MVLPLLTGDWYSSHSLDTSASMYLLRVGFEAGAELEPRKDLVTLSVPGTV